MRRFMWTRSWPGCGILGCGRQSLPELVGALGGEATLGDLRRVGETLAAQYPGYVDMGMSPVKQAC